MLYALCDFLETEGSQIMKLKSREKVLVAFMVVAIGIWAFDQFYYTPQKRKIKILKEEIQNSDLKLKESLVLAKGLEITQTEVSQMEKKLDLLGRKPMKGGEFKAFLRHLAKESERLHMKTISIAPQEEGRNSSKENEENPPSPFEKVPVQLVLHSDFYSLGDYLKGIEGLFLPVYISGIQIEKVEEIFPLLKATIGLTIYVHSPEESR